ncbi:MAG: MFS transporter [Desulfovibrionaceae bacterium]|nr:MFS transporter [Desulfovibrionaceae bacterium]
MPAIKPPLGFLTGEPGPGELGPARLCAAALVTVAAFCAIYAPQPLLAVIAAEFGVSRDVCGLLITVTLLPFGFAPVAYGFLLESFSAARLMRVCLLLLAATELAVFLNRSFALFLVLRLVQGLLIPAVTTGLMTFISEASASSRVQRNLAAYIAASIFGGFFGRLLAGFASSVLGWRWAFLILGLALAGAAVLAGSLGAAARPRLVRPGLKDLADILKKPVFLRVYVVIFGFFFVFASALNFIPFRLSETVPGAGEMRIALVYSGYLMGIVVSLASARLAGLLGGEKRALVLGGAVFLVAVACLWARGFAPVFGAVFALCLGFFLVHSVAPGLLNSLSTEKHGLVNGLYISFYYLGGTLGTFLPGLIYQALGWGAFVACLVLVAAGALGLSLGLPRPAARPGPPCLGPPSA